MLDDAAAARSAEAKLTLLLDGLQQRGLLRRKRNPRDGRSQHLVLSAKGRKFAAAADNRP